MRIKFVAGLAVGGALSMAAALAHSADAVKARPAEGHAHADGHPHAHDGDAAIGEAGDPAQATRTVRVDMADTMRFSPSRVAVRQGETVRFIVRNAGALKHEFVLGTRRELAEHYALMKKFPEMEHADPNRITLAAGATGEVVWRFSKAGKVDFACLQPGHYDAGMKGVVDVATAKGVRP